MAPLRELRAFTRAALIDPVPRDHRDTPAQLRRRRVVAGVTFAVGVVLLTFSLRLPAGDPRFTWATLVLALTWSVGAFASGPLHIGHAWTRTGDRARPGVQSLALAALLVALFLAGSLIVAHLPLLRASLDALLDHARYGSLAGVALITALNGVGEELYFRGALFAAVPPRRAVAVTAVAYTATTIGTGIPLLVMAAALLGVVTGLQRRVTGGVLGPIIVHVAWSTSMLFLLPPVLDALR